jgi:hypothetical protein
MRREGEVESRWKRGRWQAEECGKGRRATVEWEERGL